MVIFGGPLVGVFGRAGAVVAGTDFLFGSGGSGVNWIGTLGSSLYGGGGGGGRSVRVLGSGSTLGVEDVGTDTGAGTEAVEVEGISGLGATTGMAGRAFEKRDRPVGLGTWRDPGCSMAGCCGDCVTVTAYGLQGVVGRRNMCVGDDYATQCGGGPGRCRWGESRRSIRRNA